MLFNGFDHRQKDIQRPEWAAIQENTEAYPFQNPMRCSRRTMVSMLSGTSIRAEMNQRTAAIRAIRARTSRATVCSVFKSAIIFFPTLPQRPTNALLRLRPISMMFADPLA
jgi:hypothetical protein